MVMIKMRYLYQDIDRHGNVRLYFRRKGQRKIRVREIPGTAEFQARYHELLSLSNAGELAPVEAVGKRPKPGTYHWLCVKYFMSSSFRQLDPSTQRARRRILESTLVEPIYPGASETFADFPLNRFSARAIRTLRERKANLPEAANGRLKSIRRLFSWALEEDLIAVNPARDVARVKNTSQGIHSWSVEEVEQYERSHPVGSKARLALALLIYTGVRRSDVVRLGRQHIRNGWLKIILHKNRNRHPVTLEIPVLAELQKIIEVSPCGDLTFLVNDYGRPFTAGGFGNKFRDWCDTAGLPHCSAHGLRKAGASLVAENGATSQQLMAIFGWLSLAEAERYTKAASKKKLASDAMPLIRRTKE